MIRYHWLNRKQIVLTGLKCEKKGLEGSNKAWDRDLGASVPYTSHQPDNTPPQLPDTLPRPHTNLHLLIPTFPCRCRLHGTGALYVY